MLTGMGWLVRTCRSSRWQTIRNTTASTGAPRPKPPPRRPRYGRLRGGRHDSPCASQGVGPPSDVPADHVAGFL